MNDETLTATRTEAPSPEPIDVWGLAVAWSADAPERMGEVLSLPGDRGVLGRGAGDDEPRAEAWRIRPGRTVPCAPLTSRRLSRRQLELEVRARGLVVRNVGRATLRIDGEARSEAQVSEGAVLAVDRALVLVVVRRPLDLSGELADGPFGEADASGMVGESAAAWRLREELAFVAPRPGHVLLTGPSGAGKELAARALHRGGPWVSRNAVTIPESLADAELFGHVKDYPNPGMPDRRGLVGEADGGLLLLDELGDLPEAVQARLLRLMDDGEYQRLGESRARRSELRLVGATHRDPRTLKHDLLARFRHRIEVPGLRARREDVTLLARHLLRLAKQEDEHMARFFVGDEPQLAQELVERLLLYPWQTHARELDRLLWASVRHSRGDVLVVPPELEAPTLPSVTIDVPLTEERVRAALDASGGNVSEAARQLGLPNRDRLRRWLKKARIR